MKVGASLVTYGRAYRGWWWLLSVCAVAAGVAAYSFTGNQVGYNATATLVVGQSLREVNPAQAELEASHLLALTYAELALSQPVLQPVVTELDLGDDWSDLQDRVLAEAVIDTPLLEITASAESAVEAEQIADGVAAQLIEIQDRLNPSEGEGSDNDRFIIEQLASLEHSIAAAQAEAEKLESTLAESPPPGTEREVTTELELLEEQIAGWQETYATLSAVAEEQVIPRQLTVLTQAQVDPTPEPPRKLTTTIIAAILGLLFGLGVITVWERSRRPVRSEDDVTHELELPVLGAVRPIRGRTPQARLLAGERSSDPAAEDYRIIRGNIEFAALNSQPVQSVLVTKPPGGRGKTTTVANLGVVMAGAGLKTILIDGDLRRPGLHELFQLPRSPGLAEFLTSESVAVAEIQRPGPIDNLQVITSGDPIENPSDWLASSRMDDLVAELTESADIVIVDSPPALAVADPVVLARHLDGVILVIEAGRTSRETARHSISSLRLAGARILGAVLNRAPERVSYDYEDLDGRRATGARAQSENVRSDAGSSPTGTAHLERGREPTKSD